MSKVSKFNCSSKSADSTPEDHCVVSVYRIVFWIVGIVLYFTPFVLNLFDYPGIVLSILFFVVYLILLAAYLFIENVDHYRNIVLILTLVSMFIFPLFNIPSEKAGIKYRFNSMEIKLVELVNKIKESENIYEIHIYHFTEYNTLNGEKVEGDKYIFENFGVNINSYNDIKNDMKNLDVFWIQKDKSAVFIKAINLPPLIYYFDPSIKRTERFNQIYNIKLTENWFASYK